MTTHPLGRPPARRVLAAVGGLALAACVPLAALTATSASAAAPAGTSPDLTSFPATLWSVAADSPSDVWAVGYTGDGCCNSTPIALHWNGKRWESTHPLEVPGKTSTQLYGVAVLGPRDVWAVGSSTDSSGIVTLAEHWNGKKWTIVETPNPDGASSTGLIELAGDAPDDLWAVGSSYNGSTSKDEALALHWDGTTWTLSDALSPDESAWAPLRGVALAKSGPLAVGEYQDSTAGYTALAEQYSDGDWGQLTTPLPKKAAASSLFAVSDAGSGAYATGCWTLDGTLFCGAGGGDGQRPLIEHFNGTSWHRTKVRLPKGASGGGLDAVGFAPGSAKASASRSLEGWAGGEATRAGVGQPWLLHFRDGAWTSVRTPSLTGSSYVGGILTLSPTDAWIVGAGAAGTLAEHWNGTQWKVVKTPAS